MSDDGVGGNLQVEIGGGEAGVAADAAKGDDCPFTVTGNHFDLPGDGLFFVKFNANRLDMFAQVGSLGGEGENERVHGGVGGDIEMLTHVRQFRLRGEGELGEAFAEGVDLERFSLGKIELEFQAVEEHLYRMRRFGVPTGFSGDDAHGAGGTEGLFQKWGEFFLGEVGGEVGGGGGALVEGSESGVQVCGGFGFRLLRGERDGAQ